MCADLPPLHDVLDDSCALFYATGDSADLAQKIAQIMDHPEEAEARAARARKKAEDYTWEKRMTRIMNRLEGQSTSRRG